MQTPKGSRTASSEAPQKVSPRAVRHLKTTGLEIDTASSSIRTAKHRSPKVIERKSPRSPVSEKKRPSRISELEAQVSQLQEELKRAKDQLNLSESWKKEAQENAEESKNQLSAMSAKLEESQKQLLELYAFEEAHIRELQNISQQRDQAWQSEIEAVRQLHLDDTGAFIEIESLESQQEIIVAEPEATQSKHTESVDVELEILKENLKNTLSLVETMKIQLTESKESEAKSQTLANETLLQLETAKKTIEALRSDGMKVIESYHSIATELDQSKAHVNLLEGLVPKIDSGLRNTTSNLSQESTEEHDFERVIVEYPKSQESNEFEAKLSSLKSEVEQLRSALEAAEMKCHEEQINNTVQIRSAHELMEEIKSGSVQREAELEAELKETKADMEELKADLMDKESELQGISEENEGLNMKLKNGSSYQNMSNLENEIKQLKEVASELKSSLMDKETELQNVLEENVMLKKEIGKREDRGKGNGEVILELEAARIAEHEALMKLGFAMGDAEKSNKRMGRVTEQLEAAQATNSKMEAELRKLKIQSDQWRKAAEAAVAMLSGGDNGKFAEGSFDGNYIGRINLPYNDDLDDDLKKKNGNVLKKIGVLWKKPQK